MQNSVKTLIELSIFSAMANGKGLRPCALCHGHSQPLSTRRQQTGEVGMQMPKCRQKACMKADERREAAGKANYKNLSVNAIVAAASLCHGVWMRETVDFAVLCSHPSLTVTLIPPSPAPPPAQVQLMVRDSELGFIVAGFVGKWFGFHSSPS